MPNVSSARQFTSSVLAAAMLLAACLGLVGCGRGGDAGDGPSDDGRGSAGAPGSGAGATLAVTFTEAEIGGQLAAGAVGPLSITVRSASGALRAIGAAVLDSRDGRWSALLRDGHGGDVLPETGDIVHVNDHNRGYDWVVPPLVLHFGRGGDVVSGTTAAGAVVDMVVAQSHSGAGDSGSGDTGAGDSGAGDSGAGDSEPPPEQAAYAGATAAPSADAATAPHAAQAFADADGAFIARLGDGVALRGDDEVRVAVTVGGVRLNVPRRVPFARVSLHPGDVATYLRPGAVVSLTLAGPDGAVLATGRGVGDIDGRASIWAHDPAFRRRAARPGDVVTVDDGETRLAVTVPPFRAHHDLAAGTLTGLGVPGDPLDATLWNPWYPGELDEPRGAVGPDGAWSMRPKVRLHPASHYYITEYLASGDRLFYCYQAPMLHVASGSATVGVQALYYADVRLSLERAGRVVATGRTVRPWVEIAQIPLTDDMGRPVATAAGDVLKATLDGEVVEVDVEAITAAVDVGAAGEDDAHAVAGAGGAATVDVAANAGVDGDANGDGAADATATVVGTARPGAVLELLGSSPLGISTTVGADGRYRFPPSEDMRLDGALPRAGTELAVAERLPNGHFRVARLVGPAMTADIGARTVTGQALAGTRLSIVHGADRADAVADAADRFTATLPAAARVITAGDVVTLTVPASISSAAASPSAPGRPTAMAEAWSTSLRVPSFDATYDAATGRLTGRTSGELVAVAVWAGDALEPERWNVPVADVDGPWSVDLTAPTMGAEPVAAGAVRRVEAVVRVEGHGVRWGWGR
ncbi:MAG: hypothetical protein ABI780_04090 [Ardenticatenales bacterium]